MCSDPSKTKKITPVSPKLACDKPTGNAEYKDDLSATTAHDDIENGYQAEKVLTAELPKSLEKSQGLDMSGISFSQLVDKIWHFSSVDYGRDCMFLNKSILTKPKAD